MNTEQIIDNVADKMREKLSEILKRGIFTFSLSPHKVCIQYIKTMNLNFRFKNENELKSLMVDFYFDKQSPFYGAKSVAEEGDFIITREWIENNKTDKGGWTKKQIESINVFYPQVSGWIDRACGRIISNEQKIAFETNNISKDDLFRKKYLEKEDVDRNNLENNFEYYEQNETLTKEEEVLDWKTQPLKLNGQNNYLKYRLYINSPEWKEFRRYAIEQHGKFCNHCKKEGRKFDVHHVTYERLYKESVYDVDILCRRCHTKEHKRLDELNKRRKRK